MPPLSSLLLQRGVATLEQVEAALARQAVRGGDLITNLLEAADVDEAQLVEIMADCDGLRPASPGALPVPGPDTQRVLPSSLAMRHQIFPLRLLKHTLLVAVSEPLPSTVERDVSFTLGLRLEQRITTLVRIQQALALSYGAPLNRRSRRILARLDGLADPCPSEAPSPLQVGDSSLPPRLPHGPVAPPERPLALQPMAASRAPARRATLPIVPAAAPKTPALLPQPNADESNPASSPRPLHGVRHVRSRKPRRGPFTLVMARNALDQAESTSTALRVLFDFTRQFFEYTAMFLVREDLAEGNDAAGPGATGNRIRGIGVPLEIPSILSRARERRAPLLEVPSDDGIDAVLREDLQRPMHAMVLVLPLAIRNRVVALLFGDDGKVDVDLAQVGDVLALAPVVGSTIERLVLQRKVERARLSSSPSHQRSQPASPQEPPPKRRTTSTDLPQLQAPAAAQPAPAHRAAPVVAHHPSSTSTTAQRAVTSAHDPESPVLPQNAPQAQRQISPAAASVRSDLHTTADQRPGPHASDAGVLSPAAASVRGSVWDPTPPPVPDLPRVAPASSDPGMFVSRVVSGSSPLPQPSAHQAHADRWSAVLPASASDDSLNRPRAADPSPRTMLSAREPAQPDENIDKMEEPSSECSAPDQAGLAAPEPTAQRADRRTAQSSPDGETSGPPSESEQRAHEQQPGPSSDPGQGLEAEQPRRANVATATEPSGDAGAAPGSRGPT
ncbi:MAG: hypothetical protein MUF54_08440, partial [Polyangiaceae bacterium]|nr:hypothetical protein [Polyangiaceae bacterium]